MLVNLFPTCTIFFNVMWYDSFISEVILLWPIAATGVIC
mgnify:CR=1 FL=1